MALPVRKTIVPRRAQWRGIAERYAAEVTMFAAVEIRLGILKMQYISQ